MNSIDSSWLVRHLSDAAVRALIPAALAGLMLLLFRLRQATVRLAVWRGVLYAALVMPLLAFVLPPLPLRVPAKFLVWAAPVRSYTSAGAASLPSSLASNATATKTVSVARPGAGFVRPAPGAADSRSEAGLMPAFPGRLNWRARLASLQASEITVGVYLLIVVLLTGRVAAGLVISRRLRTAARRIHDPGAMRWLKWHALAMGVERAPVLLESAAISVPLTLGVWRPVILLPAGWRAWESAKLSAVIAHELSHVSRQDSRTKALAVIYRSFFWFSPLSWWLESHLAAIGEQASDLAAIGAGAEPGYYAEVLMSFFTAIQTSGARVCRQGVAMARTSPGFAVRAGRAQDRIEKVLSSNGTVPATRKARLMALLALVALPLVYLTAATRPVLVANPMAAASAAQFPAPPVPPSPAVPAPPSSPLPPSARLAVAGPPPVPPAHIAPPAPAPPPAAWAEPPLPPEPPQGGDDDDWTINNIHEGMTFAVVSGNRVVMNGSGDDQDEVKDLQKKIGGDFIWFIHSGNSYVIRDSATVARALQLYAPMEELGRQQEELGRQQEELGRKQEDLGRQQEGVRVKVPADLQARLKRIEDEIRRLGPDASQEDLGRLQGELGDLQGYIGDLQGRAGDEQGRFGAKQGELGRQQGELGEKQGKLGERQGEIAREAAHKMQDILTSALKNGKAQRAPE